jgi:hypothetical protein
MNKKVKGISKGAPSGLMISLFVHAGAFFLAGLLVVFSVVKKEEISFVPPPAVERPKMKLKKPKVKVKKSAKPSSPTRIMAKVSKAVMPELQLPELGGTGTGFGGIGDLGGFDMMPGIGDITVFGGGQTIGNDLEGTFYDFNRTFNGRSYSIDKDIFITEIARFIASGWKTTQLSRYYRSPKKLYTTTIAIPPIPSPLAPSAFGEPDNRDFCWMVHYKGKLVHKDGIRFRFVGTADDIIVVAVNGKTVLNGSRGWDRTSNNWVDCAPWTPSSADHRKWHILSDSAAVGDLIELEPGVPVDLDVMFAEVPGGNFNAVLCVMEEDVKYENNSKGQPILPLFRTAPTSRALQDIIYRGMPAEQLAITTGPIFNDFDSSVANPVVASEVDAAVETDDAAEPTAPASEANEMRVWTSLDGETFEGEFVTVIGRDAVFKTASKKQIKIPFDRFIAEDQRVVELSMPPSMKLDLGKKIRQKRLKYGAGLVGINEYTFTAKIDQTSSGDYTHKLKAEFFVIGSEIGASKYMLLDRGDESFVLSRENNRSFDFSGNAVEMLDFVTFGQRRGDRYEGFLITVTDELGRIIDYRSTPSWLYKNLEQLKALPVGSFMDKTCTRVWPTPLKAN